MEKRRQPEIIAGRVNPDGSIAAGERFTAQRASVGAYNVFLEAGFRLVAATASAYAAGNTIATTAGAGERAFSVSTLTGGAAADTAFTFVAVGVQQ